MPPVPALEPVGYTEPTPSGQHACQGTRAAQRDEALTASEDQVIHKTKIAESRATQAGLLSNPTSATLPHKPTRTAASPVSLPFRSTPPQLKGSKLSPRASSARLSKAQRVTIGDDKHAESPSSPHQRNRNQSVILSSQIQSPSNSDDEVGLRISPRASSGAASRALSPKRKATSKTKLTNMRSSKEPKDTGSRQKGEPLIRSLNPTISEQERSEALKSASDDEVADQTITEYPPQVEEQRRKVLALLREGKSRAQIMKKIPVSQYRIQQWSAEAFATGALEKRQFSNPRYGPHDEETLAEVQASVDQHESLTSIAKRTGIARSTIYRWDDKEFTIKRPGSKRPRDSISHEEQRAQVFALYESGCNDNQVSAATGIPKSTVNSWKNKGIIDGTLNLKRVFRQIYSPQTRAQAISLLTQGKSVEEVAKTMGINKGTLTKWKYAAFSGEGADNTADIGKQANDEQSYAQGHALNEEHTNGNEGLTAVSGSPKRDRSKKRKGHAAAATVEAATGVSQAKSPPSSRRTGQSSRNHNSPLVKRGTRIQETSNSPQALECDSPVHTGLPASTRGSLVPPISKDAARERSTRTPHRTRERSRNHESLMIKHETRTENPSRSPEILQCDGSEHSGNSPTAPKSLSPDTSPASSDVLIHSTSDPWQSCHFEEYWP